MYLLILKGIAKATSQLSFNISEERVQ